MRISRLLIGGVLSFASRREEREKGGGVVKTRAEKCQHSAKSRAEKCMILFESRAEKCIFAAESRAEKCQCYGENGI